MDKYRLHKFSLNFSRRTYVEQGIRTVNSVFGVYFNVENLSRYNFGQRPFERIGHNWMTRLY